MGESDTQLAAKCGAGDAAALEILYRRHVHRVWQYAWHRTHSRDAAAEIVQEVFLRVAQSADGFAGRSAFTTWLHAVARSAAIDHVRRSRRQAKLQSASLRLVRPDDESEDGTERAEWCKAVRLAVADLPSAQRDAVLLCELAELSQREAAEVLGWTTTRLKVTLFRARHRLRDTLALYVEARANRGEKNHGL